MLTSHLLSDINIPCFQVMLARNFFDISISGGWSLLPQYLFPGLIIWRASEASERKFELMYVVKVLIVTKIYEIRYNKCILVIFKFSGKERLQPHPALTAGVLKSNQTPQKSINQNARIQFQKSKNVSFRGGHITPQTPSKSINRIARIQVKKKSTSELERKPPPPHTHTNTHTPPVRASAKLTLALMRKQGRRSYFQSGKHQQKRAPTKRNLKAKIYIFVDIGIYPFIVIPLSGTISIFVFLYILYNILLKHHPFGWVWLSEYSFASEQSEREKNVRSVRSQSEKLHLIKRKKTKSWWGYKHHGRLKKLLF